jgi:hypothetical protein
VGLVLSGVTGAAQGLAASTLTIVDIDPAAVFLFAVGAYSVSDPAPSVSIVVRRIVNTGVAASVHLGVSGGTAVAGIDYTDPTQTLSFGPGVTQISIPITILNDSTTLSQTKTALFSLSSPSSNAAVTAPSATQLSILENDSTFQFSAGTFAVNENTPQVGIVVTRTLASGAATVQLTVGGGGSTAVAGVNYKAPTTNPVTLNFASGQTFAVFLLQILPANKGNTILDLALGSPTGGSGAGVGLGLQKTAVLDILDASSEEGTLQFALSAYSVLGAAKTAEITVTRSGGSGTAVVQYQTADGTGPNAATAGTDYTATSGTLTFPNGVTSQTFPVSVLDPSPGSNRFLSLSLSATGAGVLGPTSQAVLWVVE